MRICHVITRLIIGGAQENTILSCAGLVAKGHEVTLIAGPETGPEGSLWEQAGRCGAELIRLDCLRRKPSPYHDLRCLTQLTGILRDGAFDVLHTHSSKAGILGRWAANRAGTGVIAHTIHGMSFNRTQPMIVQWTYRALERHVAKFTHAFVTVADAMIDQAVAARLAPREVFTTVYSGMRMDSYVRSASHREQVRKQWGVEPEDVVVGTVARLFRNKGYEELLEVLRPALDQAPNLRFVWVGDGADRDTYVRRLEAMGLRDRVHLAGLVPPDDIPMLINGFDILLHASRWEGLPRALVQGLLMQVPGVSFDNDGAPEVIQNGETGVLAPFGDIQGLAKGIVKLAGSASLRGKLGMEGRRRCLHRFSAERMVADLERLYQRLVHSTPPGSA